MFKGVYYIILYYIIMNIFCDAVAGYGDISLTLKILKRLNMFNNIKVLFYLRKNKQQLQNVISMINSFNIRDVEYIFLFEDTEYENKYRMDAFQNNMNTLLIIPQSNLTMTIYQSICEKFSDRKCHLPNNIIGITEYNVEDFNINEVHNPLIQLGFNKTGVLIEEDEISQIKSKNIETLNLKYKKKYNTDKLYLAYISEDTFESYLTLLSFFNEEQTNGYKIIAPTIKNTSKYDVDIYNKRLSQEEFRDLTYISNNPIGITGDQSFIDALILGKVCYYDKPFWKENMINELILLLRQNNLNLLADWYEFYDAEKFEELFEEAINFSDILFQTNLDTYDKIVGQITSIVNKKGGKKLNKTKRRKMNKITKSKKNKINRKLRRFK